MGRETIYLIYDKKYNPWAKLAIIGITDFRQKFEK